MRYQILSLSGGGFRALYTVEVLRALEDHFKVACRDRFHVISGTSAGSLVAAGLVAGVPAGEIASKFEKWGPKIFRRNWHHGFRRLFLRSPYDHQALSDAIYDTLPENFHNLRLSDLDSAIIIPVVNFTHCRLDILTSNSILFRGSGSNIKLVDAVLASASAPTFFPMKKINGDDYIDGGVAANSPDLVSIFELIRSNSATLEEVFLMSIGTIRGNFGYSVEPEIQNPSALSWIFLRGLIQVFISSQEAQVEQISEFILGDRYIRVNEFASPKQEQKISEIDNASMTAAGMLKSLARVTFTRLEKNRLVEDFFVK